MQIGFKHWQQIHKAGCFVNIFPIVCLVMLSEVTDRDTKQMSEMEASMCRSSFAGFSLITNATAQHRKETSPFRPVKYLGTSQLRVVAAQLY